MNRFGFYLLRLVKVSAGFLAAVVLGSAIVLLFGFNNGRMPELSGGALALWGASLGLVSAYAAIMMAPALVIALVGEVMRWRALAFHLALGLAGAAGAYLYFLRDELEFADFPLAVTLAAGLVAGFVYWLLAGRSAGIQSAEGTEA
jgi:hypothetical protein